MCPYWDMPVEDSQPFCPDLQMQDAQAYEEHLVLLRWSRWMLAGILLLFVILSRNMLVVLGLPLPTRLIATIGFPIVFLVWVRAFWIIRHYFFYNITNGSLLWFGYMQCLLVFLLVFGLFLGAYYQVAVKDYMAFSIFVLGIMAGTHSGCWRQLEKPITVLFWVSWVLVWWGINLPMLEVTYAGSHISTSGVNFRYSNTMGGYFRPILSMGYWLFFVSVFRNSKRKSLWGLLQFLALPAILIVNTHAYTEVFNGFFDKTGYGMFILLFVFKDTKVDFHVTFVCSDGSNGPAGYMLLIQLAEIKVRKYITIHDEEVVRQVLDKF